MQHRSSWLPLPPAQPQRSKQVGVTVDVLGDPTRYVGEGVGRHRSTMCDSGSKPFDATDLFPSSSVLLKKSCWKTWSMPVLSLMAARRVWTEELAEASIKKV